MAQAGAVEPRARERQHVERHVEAEPALDVGPNSSSMRPVPVPRSSSERNGLSASAARIASSTDVVGDMQLADAVPFGGVAREIFLRGGSARGTHGRKPLAVARDGGVVGIEPRDQFARQRRAAAALAQPEERPGAFAEALDQPGLGQEPQMPGDARLRLAQNVGEVGDGQFGLGQQRDDAQPRLLAGGLEGAVEGGEGELGRRRPWPGPGWKII